MAFDPDAFLGGAPSDEERPSFLTKKPKGGFDPDAFLGGATETRPLNNTGPDLAGQLKTEAADVPSRVARNASVLDSAANGAANGMTFGFADELQGAGARAADILARRQGKTYAQYRDEARAFNKETQAAHPVAAGVGELAGGLLTVPLTGGAGGGGAVGAAIQAGKFGALSGAGNSEADLTKGEVGKFAQDVGSSAALNAAVGGATSKLVRGAPERVDERVLSGISRGEAGGAAKDRLYRKVVARAGEDGEGLFDALQGDEQVKRALAVRAKSNPGAVAKLVEKKIDKLTPETEPFYKAIDNAPDPRFADPAHAPKNGGVDIGQVAAKFEKSRAAALANGNGALAEAYDKAQARLVANYGKDGVLVPGTKLPARALRNYANEIGEGLFSGDVSPSFKARAQQQIYRDVVGAIEDEGTRVGLDMSKLRSLNKSISTLIPVRDALADRAAKAASGRTSLANLLTSSALIGGGAAAGGSGGGGIDGAIQGALGGAALATGRRIALRGTRSADYTLAQLVRAARAGSTSAQLGQLAIEMGVSREVAQQIARRGLGAVNEEPPTD